MDALTQRKSSDEPELSPKLKAQLQSEETRYTLINRFRSSLYAFNLGVMGFRDMYLPLHKRVCDYIEQIATVEGLNRLLLEMSRGHFKSSIASKGLPCWLLARDPDVTMAIFNHKTERAVEWVSVIKKTFEQNIVFRALFSDIIPDFNKTLWQSDKIIIKRSDSMVESQPSVVGTSIQSGQAGGHPLFIINDDLIHEENAKSAPEVKRAVDNMILQEELLADPNRGGILWVGTPWGFGDPHEWVRENLVEDGLCSHLRIPCYDDDGNPVFPTRFTKERLRERERILGPFQFSCQYLCNPYDESQGNFTADSLRYFQRNILGKLTFKCPHKGDVETTLGIQDLFIAMQVDPAYSDAEGAAESAIVVNGIAKCGCRFLFEAEAGHWDPWELIQKMYAVGREYVPWLRKIGIEAVSFQRVYRFWMMSMEQRRVDGNQLPGVDIIDLKPDKGVLKEVRIKSQQIPLANGEWHILPGLTKFLHQFQRFPRVRPLDILDAWAYSDQMFEDADVRMEGGSGENLGPMLDYNRLFARSASKVGY